jgi:hypothetical protein
VKKLLLAGMLAVPLMASVAWADCLRDDPYYGALTGTMRLRPRLTRRRLL